MRRDEQRRLLWFVLIIMICGGGCMAMPYSPRQKVDLRLVGIDGHVRDRLVGLADVRPGDPVPASSPGGKLMVAHMSWRWVGARTVWGVEPDQTTLDRLNRLDGIDTVAALPIFGTEEQRLSEATSSPADDYKKDLLRLAQDEGADLLLVYTSSDEADTLDTMLWIGQFLTLGFAPTIIVAANAEAEAVLLDVHTGYAYAITEADGGAAGLTNTWGREYDKRRVADKATREAFNTIVERLESAWPMIRRTNP